MTRVSLRTLLQGVGDDAVRECLQRWSIAPGDSKTRGVARAAEAMENDAVVFQRMGALPRKLQDLLEAFFGDGGPVRGAHTLFVEVGRHFKNRFDFEAALAALQREAFVWPVRDRAGGSAEQICWAAPTELVECVQKARRRRQHHLQDSLTLQGFLDLRFFRDRDAARDKAKAAPKNGRSKPGDDKAAEDKAADHARKIYKLYTLDSAIAQRLQKLPRTVGEIVNGALQKHGGVGPWDELLRDLEPTDPPDPAFVGKALEEALVGTVADLDLARIGIQPARNAIVVFHEVALYALRRRGEEQPPQVAEELSCGGDMATNVTRFLRELQQSKVLFTADGDLFKASQKRIAQMLLPVPGGFLGEEALLEVVYRFCLHRRLIDRRGERALRPTPAGGEFDRAPLAEQVKMLLAHFVEDRTLSGEPWHQTRMRRVLLRLLRRATPMLWQDVSILPFLARNAYLAQIDCKQAEEFFSARFKGGGYTPTETLQQMCWNLLLWVRKRLYPLGLVDVGMHGGRVTALRLSRLGAELLDTEPAGKVGGTRSTVIVQPDFEVLLFPGDDVHDVVHLFDRFARRTKTDHVHQFRLEEETVRAGVADGLSGSAILQELTDRARAPLPQNVLYTLEEWTQKPAP